MKFILLLIDVHLLHSSFDILVTVIQTEIAVLKIYKHCELVISLYKLVIKYRKFYLFEGNSIGIKNEVNNHCLFKFMIDD